MEAEAAFAAAGLTSRVAIAAALGLTPQAISRWLGGGNAGPQLVGAYRRWREPVQPTAEHERRLLVALRRLAPDAQDWLVSLVEAVSLLRAGKWPDADTFTRATRAVDHVVAATTAPPRRKSTPETPLPDLKQALDDSDEHHIDPSLLEPDLDTAQTLKPGIRAPGAKRRPR